MIVLGRIVGAYGVRGWVWLHPFADDPESWVGLESWGLAASETAPESEWRAIEVESTRIEAGKVAVKFAAIDDRNGAEGLKGQYVGVAREQMPTPAEGEYYWGDLVGMQVHSPGGEVLGEVVDLIASSANDVLVVSGDPRMLIPFVAPIIQRVDVAQRVIHADWQKGW